ncbi:hypothetical protein KIN20_024632 [Parelaphostrongylus tenuis]|uniref:Uncharacterized protein n=1 Tax=Parelaphostrongylus tenuis TaxID=148309 RepID=A0AAD5QXM7_PARTN|nr:hypothetical protein KIN20_024632 [Parelaphostrongylus tenuis]
MTVLRFVATMTAVIPSTEDPAERLKINRLINLLTGSVRLFNVTVFVCYHLIPRQERRKWNSTKIDLQTSCPLANLKEFDGFIRTDFGWNRTAQRRRWIEVPASVVQICRNSVSELNRPNACHHPARKYMGGG